MNLVVYNASSQTLTFNKRMTLGCVNTVLTGLEVTDSCYYVTGFARDTTNCYNSTVFVKFDTFGDAILHKILPNDTARFETWAPSLKTDNDGNLIVTAYWRDTASMYGNILKYNSSGSLLSSPFYSSPYGAGEFMRPDDVDVLWDSGYVLVSSVNDAQGISNVSISRIDNSGNEIWNRIRGVANFAEIESRSFVDSDNSIVVSYLKINTGFVGSNFTIRCIIEKLDSAGNSVWQYESPLNEQVYGANDLIKSKDGGWIIASAWGSEMPGGSGSIALSQGYVFKLDSARNFEWGKVLYSDAASEGVTKKVVELEDSSIVAFGNVVRLYPPPPATTSYGVTHGHIVKLSPYGDSIWSRDYEYMTTPGAKNYINDAERTYDGGFLICGESRGSGSGVLQQGWLLKLDEQGCLVPGCHLGLGVLPVGSMEEVDLKLYPNPTTDYLNVHYQASKVGDELTFSVIDLQGGLLQRYNTADVSDKTYIVPVYDLVGGMYVLEVRRDGELVKSEPFVKR